jgi:hypothetical protein
MAHEIEEDAYTIPVPSLFQRPPVSSAPSPVHALSLYFLFVIRQAVRIKRKLHAPAA